MAKMHRLSLIAMALVLGGGVLQLAGAQQPRGAPQTDGINALSRPQEPASLLRLNPHAGSESATPSQSPDAVGPVGAPPLPRVQSDRGIRYVSGGVGEGERTELEALSNQFNLRLLFAMQGSGEYLSAIRVNILDAHGATILTAESKGPWFFAQLAPGDYTVETSIPGQAQQQSQRQSVHIEHSGQSRLDFHSR